MDYSIQDHCHRLAAWDAATSARASPLYRFAVNDGVWILEKSGFSPSLSLDDLPTPADLDLQHAEWCELVINAAAARFGASRASLSHGVAAKLINSYLKARFVCGGFHHEDKVKALHPPIDAVLLNGLALSDFGGRRRQWREFLQARWSRFNAKTYQEVINLIRETLGQGEPLWMIEAYWRGYQ